jgi:hypothetical protein
MKTWSLHAAYMVIYLLDDIADTRVTFPHWFCTCAASLWAMICYPEGFTILCGMNTYYTLRAGILDKRLDGAVLRTMWAG